MCTLLISRPRKSKYRHDRVHHSKSILGYVAIAEDSGWANVFPRICLNRSLLMASAIFFRLHVSPTIQHFDFVVVCGQRTEKKCYLIAKKNMIPKINGLENSRYWVAFVPSDNYFNATTWMYLALTVSYHVLVFVINCG